MLWRLECYMFRWETCLEYKHVKTKRDKTSITEVFRIKTPCFQCTCLNMLFDLTFDESILIRVGFDFIASLQAVLPLVHTLLLMVQVRKVVANSVDFVTSGVIAFGSI